MEWTTIFKTNHHFLKPSLGADHESRDDQSAAPLSVFRRSESADVDCYSQVHDDNSAAAAVAAATARRKVSISRSGRYKSKTKQRVRLFSNDLNGPTDTAADTRASSVAVDPVTVTSLDKLQHAANQFSRQTVVGARKPHASTVEVARTSVKSSADVAASREPSSQSYVTVGLPSYRTDACLHLSVAEADESTDL